METPREPHRIFFETLGNQTRWDIVNLLQQGAYNVTDIAAELGYEQSLISHHLKRLTTCGFVKVKPNGTERIYTLNKKAVAPLLRLMKKHIENYCAAFCVKEGL